MIFRIFNSIREHKLIATISLFLLIGISYFTYQNLIKDEDEIRYMTAVVEKGTLVVSMSGNGQVSVSDQIDIKPKVSGDLVYVGVKNGQEVTAGTLLAQIDTQPANQY